MGSLRNRVIPLYLPQRRLVHGPRGLCVPGPLCQKLTHLQPFYILLLQQNFPAGAPPLAHDSVAEGTGQSCGHSPPFGQPDPGSYSHPAPGEALCREREQDLVSRQTQQQEQEQEQKQEQEQEQRAEHWQLPPGPTGLCLLGIYITCPGIGLRSRTRQRASACVSVKLCHTSGAIFTASNAHQPHPIELLKLACQA